MDIFIIAAVCGLIWVVAAFEKNLVIRLLCMLLLGVGIAALLIGHIHLVSTYRDGVQAIQTKAVKDQGLDLFVLDHRLKSSNWLLINASLAFVWSLGIATVIILVLWIIGWHMSRRTGKKVRVQIRQFRPSLEEIHTN